MKSFRSGLGTLYSVLSMAKFSFVDKMERQMTCTPVQSLNESASPEKCSVGVWTVLIPQKIILIDII
jgi:hypothetical protein